MRSLTHVAEEAGQIVQVIRIHKRGIAFLLCSIDLHLGLGGSDKVCGH